MEQRILVYLKSYICERKIFIMAKITLKYDARNALAKKTLAYILSLGVFKKVTEVDESLKEIKQGKINSYKNVDELFDNVLK